MSGLPLLSRFPNIKLLLPFYICRMAVSQVSQPMQPAWHRRFTQERLASVRTLLARHLAAAAQRVPSA